MARKKITLAGVDYSLNCPALCIYEDFGSDLFTWDQCQVYFQIDSKKYATETNRVTGQLLKPFDCQEQRYNSIAHWFVSLIEDAKVDYVALEDYAFAAKGRVFNIAENTAVFKHKLWMLGYTTVLIPPTGLKKFATGRGNAKKDDMYNSFLVDTGVDLVEQLGYTKSKIDNPISDIVDSFYAAKFLQNLYKEQLQHERHIEREVDHRASER